MTRTLLLLLSVACRSDSEPPEAPTSPTSPPTSPPVDAGPTLQEVAFFQGVEIPVWAAPDPVDERAAPIVAGRDAVVRARVDVPADWTPADVTLAVALTAGGNTETFTATALIDAGDDLVASVPAAALTVDATYQVRLLLGDQETARFPEGGAATLDAIETGPVTVRLVPFDVDGFVPDTSAAVVDGYREALLASFPISGAELTVAPVEQWDGGADLGDILVYLGQIQEQAMIAGEVGWDVYYYGMVTGAASREEFTGDITGTSEGGGSEDLVRAYFAVGAAFGDAKAEGTFLHELGHVHGLAHTPCDGEDDVDPDYPYPDGSIGVEGYDRRTGTFVPAETKDLMTYCDPRWISDYGYAKIADHVVGAQSYAGFE